jgi:hydroxyacyl-ACP dehydratase HTD2-like protein with hotdog domain
MSYQDYVGKTETVTDTVSPPLIRGLAATLDIPEPEFAPAGLLPPLGHWMLFQDWTPAHGLGEDGHPKRGGFMPPVHDLPRRMWAGGRVRFLAPLYAGQPVTRVSTIVKIEEKSGASGCLVFVTVHQRILGPDGVAIEEEQDIVYRSAEGAAVKPADAAPPPPAGPAARTVSRVVDPNTVLLFRYSALIGNAHRIHYDQDFTMRQEGYPGIVVHGPLQATWLADMVRRHSPGARITSFAYRGRRPAFHQNKLTLLAWAQDGGLHLESRDHQGAVCMSADATLA